MSNESRLEMTLETREHIETNPEAANIVEVLLRLDLNLHEATREKDPLFFAMETHVECDMSPDPTKTTWQVTTATMLIENIAMAYSREEVPNLQQALRITARSWELIRCAGDGTLPDEILAQNPPGPAALVRISNIAKSIHSGHGIEGLACHGRGCRFVGYVLAAQSKLTKNEADSFAAIEHELTGGSDDTSSISQSLLYVTTRGVTWSLTRMWSGRLTVNMWPHPPDWGSSPAHTMSRITRAASTETFDVWLDTEGGM